VANSALYALAYDVVNDFRSVVVAVTFPYVMVAKKNLAGWGLERIYRWLKANPARASQGSAGVAD